MNSCHYFASIMGLSNTLGNTCPNSLQDGRLRDGSRAQYGSWMRTSSQMRSPQSFSKKRDESKFLGDWRQNKQESSKYGDSRMGSGAKGTSDATSN